MPRTIHVLPDAVANQIAAGEVVERPASVVKELVENALDAGARRVEMHLASGGKRRSGCRTTATGMGREDALLALDRHATSKISAADDLRGIRSFGFRGEALPSIASGRASPWRPDPGRHRGHPHPGPGGTVTEVEDHPRTPGTTVVVERLFFNAPARARFLRAPAAETRAVNDALTPLALANPGVAFLLSPTVAPSWSSLRPTTSWHGSPGSGARRRQGTPRGGSRGGGERGSASGGDPAPGPGPSRLPPRPPLRGRPPLPGPGDPPGGGPGYRTTVPPDHRPWVFLYLEVPGGAWT
jgi:hypothetical protein